MVIAAEEELALGRGLHQLHHRRDNRTAIAQLLQVAAQVTAGPTVVEAVQLVGVQLVTVHQATGGLDGHGHLNALTMEGVHQPGKLRAHGRWDAEVVGQVDRRAKQPAVLARDDLAHQFHPPLGVVLGVAQARADQAFQALAGGLVRGLGGRALHAEQRTCGGEAKGE
ncbi:hypothetical protein D3C79_786160 [compost metagenome]